MTGCVLTGRNAHRTPKSTIDRALRTAREITVSFYTPHPALSPSRGEEEAVNYFSNGPNLPPVAPQQLASSRSDAVPLY